jgi:hypothetical protein
LFFPERPLLRAKQRPALLHDFESWFTEAGANCNAEGGRFRDSTFLGAARRAVGYPTPERPQWFCISDTLQGQWLLSIR